MKTVDGIVKLLMLSLTGSQLRSFVESRTVNLLKRLETFYRSHMRPYTTSRDVDEFQGISRAVGQKF